MCIIRLQCYALSLVNKLFVGLNVVTTVKVVVVITLILIAVITLSELNGEAGNIVVGIYQTVEVISLSQLGGKSGMNLNLSLPLRAACALGNGERIYIAVMIDGRLSNGGIIPAVVSKPCTNLF